MSDQQETANVPRPMELRLEPHRAAIETIYADTWTNVAPDDPNIDGYRTFQWWRSVHAVRVLVDAGFTITPPDGSAGSSS